MRILKIIVFILFTALICSTICKFMPLNTFYQEIIPFICTIATTVSIIFYYRHMFGLKLLREGLLIFIISILSIIILKFLSKKFLDYDLSFIPLLVGVSIATSIII